MSVWSRIRWVNVTRVAAAVAAIALVVAWPRLGSAPPSVPDGAPVPVGLPAGGEAPAERSSGLVDAPEDEGEASSRAAPPGASGPSPSGRRTAETLVAREPGERVREKRASRRGRREATTIERRRRPSAPSPRSRRNVRADGRAVTPTGARGGTRAGTRGGAPPSPRVPHPTSAPLPTASAPRPPVPDRGAAPSRSEFDFER